MRKVTAPILISFFVLIFIACESDRAAMDEEETNEPEVLQTGIASWYGPGFHGRLTSSRDRFDQDSLTAAHRTLPFGTIVEVIHSDTEKSVEVRINDRGPYAGDRIIDLSRGAAEQIDLLDSGVAQVDLILVEAGGEIPEDLNRETFTLQIGEYFSTFFAERFLESVGDGARIEQEFSPGLDRTRYRI